MGPVGRGGAAEHHSPGCPGHGLVTTTTLCFATRKRRTSSKLGATMLRPGSGRQRSTRATEEEPSLRLRLAAMETVLKIMQMLPRLALRTRPQKDGDREYEEEE